MMEFIVVMWSPSIMEQCVPWTMPTNIFLLGMGKRVIVLLQPYPFQRPTEWTGEGWVIGGEGHWMWLNAMW